MLSNEKLYAERDEFYKVKAHMLLKNILEAAISVDWSATDKRKDFHILRASLSLHGRSEVIYEEVHEESDLNNRKIHNRFLHKLKKILPPHLKVILLTDAGFCNPWFKEAKRLGFDFIGRTKSETQFSENDGKDWQKCSTLYDKATNQAKLLQNGLLAKTNKMACHIVLYKETIKGRVRKTRGGKKCQSSHSKRIAKRQKTPWSLSLQLMLIHLTLKELFDSLENDSIVPWGNLNKPDMIYNIWSGRPLNDDGFD